jgi:hypothetical protein
MRQNTDTKKFWEELIQLLSLLHLTCQIIYKDILTYLLRGATVLVELWPPHILYVRFRDSKLLQGGVVSPTPNPQPGGPVWHLPRNLSGMGSATSSCAATDIALEFIGSHKPPHPAIQLQRYKHRTELQNST